MNYRNFQIEHDACGIGTVVNIDGHQDQKVLDDALTIVENSSIVPARMQPERSAMV